MFLVMEIKGFQLHQERPQSSLDGKRLHFNPETDQEVCLKYIFR